MLKYFKSCNKSSRYPLLKKGNTLLFDKVIFLLIILLNLYFFFFMFIVFLFIIFKTCFFASFSFLIRIFLYQSVQILRIMFVAVFILTEFLHFNYQWHIQMKFRQSSFRKTVECWGGWGRGGGCCEPPVGLGESTGGGPGSSTAFLIQNTSFILNLLISMMLIIQHLQWSYVNQKQTSFNKIYCVANYKQTS